MKLERQGGQKTALWGLKNRIIVYAGQYYDSETGLHYNYHRYYDPQLGRYLRADPIGLRGGVNLYTYVQNNPINYLDFFGLFCKIVQQGDPYLGGDPRYQLHLITNVGGITALVNNALINLVGIYTGPTISLDLSLSWTVHHEIVQGFREYIDYAEECYDDCTGELISKTELGPFETGRTGEVTLKQWDEPVTIGIK